MSFASVCRSLSEVTGAHRAGPRALCKYKPQRGERMNLSDCLLFMARHLLHSFSSSSLSLTPTLRWSNAIIIPAHPIFFKGVKCTGDEIFSILFSLPFLSLPLFHSLSSSHPSCKAYIVSLMFVKGMTVTVMLSTAIMQPQQKKKKNTAGSTDMTGRDELRKGSGCGLLMRLRALQSLMESILY